PSTGDQVGDGPAGVEPLGRLRITVTGGPGPLGPSGRGSLPTLVVAAGPAPTRAPTAEVVTVEWRVNEHSPLAGAKTTSYLEHVLVLAEAHRRGADEAVSANTAGALAEGTGSNVFLVVDGELCTPSLTTGCLRGVTRDLVLDQVPVLERDDLTLHDLRRAPEAFLTSSLRDVHPIARVDGQTLAAAPGGLTQHAAQALAALQAATLDP
ncbi:MAG: aminotransferase class IV, partial [Acidimicrobiia bacterium]|nr:aminotransferase class IV [Acidimicrobiia bacterium]